jgi:hypothetical protein
MRRELARRAILTLLAAEPAAASAAAAADTPPRGQEQWIGSYLAELAPTAQELTLRVSDASHQPVETANMSATATVVSKDGRQKSVALKPAGENRLAGKIDFALPDDRFRAMVILSSGVIEVGKAGYTFAPAKR